MYVVAYETSSWIYLAKHICYVCNRCLFSLSFLKVEISGKTRTNFLLLLNSNHLKCMWQNFFLFARLNFPNVLISIAKKKIKIVIFLPRVLLYQKRQISLPAGYKKARPKQETGNDCDVISGLQASRKTDFSDIFLFSYNQRTIVPFLSQLISSQ